MMTYLTHWDAFVNYFTQVKFKHKILELKNRF